MAATNRVGKKEVSTAKGQLSVINSPKKKGNRKRDYKLESKIEVSAVIEYSLQTLEQKLYELLHGNAEFMIIDDFVSSSDEEDIFEEYEIFDNPDDEYNIETGEVGASSGPSETADSESFIDFAWRQYFEQFAGEEPEIRDIVSSYLKSWEYPYYPVRQKLQMKPEHKMLIYWFDNLKHEYAGPIQDPRPKYVGDSPDIIFTVNGDTVKFEICMGKLERFLIGQPIQGMLKLKNGVGIPLQQLNNILSQRRDALEMLAEFLIHKLQKFLKSATLLSSVKNLKLLQQKDFVHYTEEIGSPMDKSVVSRLVRSKFIKFPFYEELLPASFCFENNKLARNQKTIELAQQIIEKSFDILLTKYPGKTLSGTNQAKVISENLGIEYTSAMVSKTLWAHLQEGKYANRKELWSILRITGTDENGNKLQKNIPASDKLSATELSCLIEEVRMQMDGD